MRCCTILRCCVAQSPLSPRHAKLVSLFIFKMDFLRAFSQACGALPTPGVLGKRIRAALRRIAWFYSRNFADRRTDREKGVLARAWNCSSALTELKGRARARFEGAALVAAFVAKLLK